MPRPSAASARSRISARCGKQRTARRTTHATPNLDGRPARIASPLRLQARPQRLHRRRPDAADPVELVDRGEAAVLFAEVDDVLSRDRADAVDRVELLDRSRAEA